MRKETMIALGFFNEVKRMEDGICPFCSKKVDPDKDFRDALSRREFGISGLCQECQDKMFGK